MSNEKKEFMLGKNYAGNFERNLSHIFSEFKDNEVALDYYALALNDIYLSGYAYAPVFEHDIDRYYLAMLTLLNQVHNPFGVINLEGDVLSLFLVDNIIEKKNVETLTREIAANSLDSELLGKFKVYTSVEQIERAGLGVAILTLDELPDFLVKYTALVEQRVANLNAILEITFKILDSSAGKDIYLDDPAVDGKLREQLVQLANQEELYFDFTLEEELKLSCYALHSKVQMLIDFLTEQQSSYQTTKIVCDRDEQGNEIEVGEKVYTYRNAPLGLVYVFNGYLYNNPEYYKKRQHVFSYIRALNPQTLVWCDQYRDEQTLNLEDITNLVVRSVQVNLFSYYLPYFAKVSNVFSSNGKINFALLPEFQDIRTFNTGHGLTPGSDSTLRLAPSKNLQKVKNIDAQLFVALTFALQQRQVLVLSHDVEKTCQEIEAACKEVPELRAISNYLTVVSDKELPFFRTTCAVAVVLKEVKLTHNLISCLSSIISSSIMTYSPLIIYGTDFEGRNNKRRKQNNEAETPSDLEQEFKPLIEQQEKEIKNWLRNRRIRRRNNISQDGQLFYAPALGCVDEVSPTYFNLQEQRNWNSQLSSDKFLTVRLNDLEISYYPNLNSNLMVLGGMNHNFFTNCVGEFKPHAVNDASFSRLGSFYHANLNSGDLITNVSIAIHRLINLFNNAENKVGSLRGLSVYWILNDEEHTLAPLYAKLFNNIFNKEENARVNVKIYRELTSPVESNSVLDKENSNLQDFTKSAYDEAVHVVNQIRNDVLSQLLDSKLAKDEKNQKFIDDLINSNVDDEFARYLDFGQKVEDQESDFYLDAIALVIGGLLLPEGTERQLHEIVIMTQEEYNLHGKFTHPDLVVLENVSNLYSLDKSAETAAFIGELFEQHDFPVVLVSSPETCSQVLLEHLDATDNRVINPRLIYDLPSADRYAYGIHVDKAQHFKVSEFDGFAKAEQLDDFVALIKQGVDTGKVDSNVLLFDLPMVSYALPRGQNPDYAIQEIKNLEGQRIFNAYIPSLGEKVQKLFLNNLAVTNDKLVNLALSILLQPRSNKVRGLFVTTDPELYKFFSLLAPYFGFSVHNPQSLKTERAVFSHAVVMVTGDTYIDQELMQRTTLLTRGFKTPGSVFLIADFNCINYYLAIISRDHPFEIGGRGLNLDPSLSRLHESKAINQKTMRADNFSAYFDAIRYKNEMPRLTRSRALNVFRNKE